VKPVPIVQPDPVVGAKDDKVVPKKEYAREYYHSFKGNPAINPNFELFGPESDTSVKFEPAGLRKAAKARRVAVNDLDVIGVGARHEGPAVGIGVELGVVARAGIAVADWVDEVNLVQPGNAPVHVLSPGATDAAAEKVRRTIGNLVQLHQPAGIAEQLAALGGELGQAAADVWPAIAILMAADAHDDIASRVRPNVERVQAHAGQRILAQQLALAAPAADEVGVAEPTRIEARAIHLALLILRRAPEQIVWRGFLRRRFLGVGQFRGEIQVVLGQDQHVAPRRHAQAIVVTVRPSLSPRHADRAPELRRRLALAVRGVFFLTVVEGQLVIGAEDDRPRGRIASV
jgi:hypothetical protein